MADSSNQSGEQERARGPERIGINGDPHRIYDLGLAVERTALAWQRTVLAVVLASVVASRYAAHWVGGIFPIVLGAGGIVCGVIALLWVRYRYRTTTRSLNIQGTTGSRDGVPLLLLMVALVCVALCVAVFAVTRLLHP